jgi:hypothetical protein
MKIVLAHVVGHLVLTIVNLLMLVVAYKAVHSAWFVDAGNIPQAILGTAWGFMFFNTLMFQIEWSPAIRKRIRKRSLLEVPESRVARRASTHETREEVVAHARLWGHVILELSRRHGISEGTAELMFGNAREEMKRLQRLLGSKTDDFVRAFTGIGVGRTSAETLVRGFLKMA